MVETIMYVGIGFMFAALIGLAVIPLVHGRAVRLSMRRLEAAIPASMAEVQADKDLLRAEFAMSTRRLETSLEQLKNKTTSQLAELGKKDDAINRLKIERDAQKVEVIALKTQVEALKEVKAAGDVVSLVPRDWPPAELVKVPMDSSQSPPPNDQRQEGDAVSLVPKEWPTAEKARSGGPARDPDARRDSSDPIEMARQGSDFSAGLRAVEPSIHVPPRSSGFKNDQFASDRPSIRRRTFSSHARFFIAALIGVGATFAWQFHGDETKEVVRTWAPSLGWLSSVSTTKSPPAPAPAAAATSPELVQQLARDLAAVRHSVEQFAAKQEQMARNVATLQAGEQDIRQKMPSPLCRLGRNSLRRRRRDPQPLPAGRFVRLLMARRSWKALMASGGRRAETRCREWGESTLLFAGATVG